MIMITKDIFPDINEMKFLFRVEEIPYFGKPYLQIRKLKNNSYFLAVSNNHIYHFGIFNLLNANYENEQYWIQSRRTEKVKLEKINTKTKNKDIYEHVFNGYKIFNEKLEINTDIYKLIDVFDKDAFAFSKFCTELAVITKKAFSFNINYFNYLLKTAGKNRLRVFLDIKSIENGIYDTPIVFLVKDNLFSTVFPRISFS